MSHARAKGKFPSEVSPEEEIEQIILDNLQSQNELEYQLGDTLDIKTSIVLVVITFLATLSSGLLTTQMPRHWHNIQLASVGCLIFAGLLSVWELIPRTYKVGLAPDKFFEWVQGVKTFYGAEGVSDPDERSLEFIHRKRIDQLRARFTHNRTINAMKSNVVTCVFILTFASLILNLSTLAALSTGWRF
jgi:hypothetical protein